jgi:hypothetical protein
MRDERRPLFSAIAALFLTIALFIGAIAFQANDHRWRQGPVVLTISPTHGLHEMDLRFIGAAAACAVLALIAAVMARR